MKKSVQSYLYSFIKKMRHQRELLPVADQKRMVIYIHHVDPLAVSWVMINEHNNIEETIIHGDPTTWAEKVNQRFIHVIIPGQDVVLTQVELPALSHERLLQALPYAVEDKLIDDVENLHFSMADSPIPGVTSVAIMNKEKVGMYLKTLKLFGIIPHTLIPVMLTLPCLKQHWSIRCDDAISFVRMNAFGGFACDTSNLDTYLQLQLFDTVEKPHGIQIDNMSQHSIDLTIDLVPVTEVVLTEHDWIEKTAILWGKYPYINLLQGDYRTRIKSVEAKKIWKWAAVFAGVWFSVSLVSEFISFVMLHDASDRSEQQIRLIYHQQFPAATNVVAPRERMAAALKKVSLAANKNNFLTWLGIWGSVVSKKPGVYMLHVGYQENQLNVAVSARSFDLLDAFVRELSLQNVTVKQQNAGVIGSDVKANILITKGDQAIGTLSAKQYQTFKDY